MTKNILHNIEKNMSSFSKGQKLIARFILENYDKAAFMTASKLGKTVQVSESTVVRFATSWATTAENVDTLIDLL
mgnify:CR=1 FL=1